MVVVGVVVSIVCVVYGVVVVVVNVGGVSMLGWDG